jgi:hypothetical protein
MYLAGFAIECLLKAALWARRAESDVRRLLFSHELEALRDKNPVLSMQMDRDPTVSEMFAKVCGWNVYIRYNPKRVDKREAEQFMAHLTEVWQWLRDRV